MEVNADGEPLKNDILPNKIPWQWYCTRHIICKFNHDLESHCTTFFHQ